MNVFFEEDGGFKVASVMSETAGALQVESASGKRSKIKAANVLLRFESVLASFMEAANAEADALEKLAAAQTQGEKLSGTTVKITQKAGVDGRLFGSVTNFDISEELVKAGYQVSKAQIRMPKGPIKTVGDSSVSVALHTDVLVDINVSVYGETN